MPVEINEQMSFSLWHNFMSKMAACSLKREVIRDLHSRRKKSFQENLLNRSRRILDRCKTRGDRGARRRKRKQSKDRLRHDPEHSFGADEKSDKIKTGLVLMGSTADSNNCSVGQDDLETKNIVAGYTVLQAAWTARIGRNISADRAVLQTCGIWGIK